MTEGASRRRRALALLAVASVLAAIYAAVVFDAGLADRTATHVAPRQESARSTRMEESSRACDLTGVVRERAGALISHASVCAYNVQHDPMVAPRRCARTGEDGSFALTDLPAGRYFVRATADGFAPASANQGAPLAVARSACPSPAEIALEPGGSRVAGVVLDAAGGPVADALVRVLHSERGEMLDIEADEQGRFAVSVWPGRVGLRARAPGYAMAVLPAVAPASGLQIVLTPGASVQGTVLAADDDEPVADVTVRAVPLGSWAAPIFASAVSREDGQFSITGLEPGRYVLSAEGDRVRGENPDPIELGLAETSRGHVVEVHPALRVSGRVLVQDTNEPCYRGSVMLSTAEDAERPVPTMMAEIDSAYGAVAFASVPPGRYQVGVQCRDRVAREGPLTIDVGDRDLGDLLWLVSPGVGLRVKVVDSLGRAVPYASFIVRIPMRKGRTPVSLPLVSDGQGQYELRSDQPPGVYVVEPSGAYHGKAVRTELRDGSGLNDVVLRLDGAASLTVEARTPEGQPVEGLAVVATPADDASAALPPPSPAASPVSSPEASARDARLVRRYRDARVSVGLGGGRYRIAPLEPGVYEVEVEDRVNPGVPVRFGGATRLQVSGAEDVRAEVLIRRAATIRGRVLDQDGQPLENAWVSAAHEDGGDDARRGTRAEMLLGPPAADQRTLTDVDGQFVLERLSDAARFTVRATQPYGGQALLRGVLAGSDVVLRLPALGSLRGRVEDERGQGVALASVHVVDKQHQQQRGSMTGTDGSFRFDDIAAGELDIHVLDPQGRSAHRTVELAGKQVLQGLQLVVTSSSETKATASAGP